MCYYKKIQGDDTMYRKFDDQLIAWKQKNNHLPLLIKGARFVGKRYSVLKFAKANYEHVIEINFEQDMYMKEVFEQNVGTVIQSLKAYKLLWNAFIY